jgi:hypothetical protein
MLESKGRGNDDGTDDAVWICDSEIDEVEDGASTMGNPVAVVVVAAGGLLESSCRACNPIRGFGEGRRSYTSSLSKMPDPCRLACALWQKNSKPQSRAYISFWACGHGRLADCRRLRQSNDNTRRRARRGVSS